MDDLITGIGLAASGFSILLAILAIIFSGLQSSKADRVSKETSCVLLEIKAKADFINNFAIGELQEYRRDFSKLLLGNDAHVKTRNKRLEEQGGVIGNFNKKNTNKKEDTK